MAASLSIGWFIPAVCKGNGAAGLEVSAALQGSRFRDVLVVALLAELLDAALDHGFYGAEIFDIAHNVGGDEIARSGVGDQTTAP